MRECEYMATATTSTAEVVVLCVNDRKWPHNHMYIKWISAGDGQIDSLPACRVEYKEL